MKDIILPVWPQFIALMASGEKREELRKRRPDCELPFRCRLYCAGPEDWILLPDGRRLRHGRIVGEFVCDAIREYGRNEPDRMRAAARGAVSLEFLRHYWGRCATVYGLHISELRLYGEPMTLEEFGLTRAPQTWCYAKEAL